MPGEQGERSRYLIWSLGVIAAIGVAVAARLEDPLSTWVIPAEDPYTHMALVRDHLADGSLDPLHEGGKLYPPGMHAVVAAAWAFTGADLYGLFRFTPIIFGALGVLALSLLLLRFEGPAAGILGAFAIALAPEAVVRTTMMAPTAMDLFLLPVFLYALLHVALGRMAWLGVAAPVGLFLVFSHPWVFGIMAMTGVAFLLLALALPWDQDIAPQVTGRGLVAGAALIAAGVAMSVGGCWDACGPGFKVVLGNELASTIGAFSSVILGVVGLIAVLLVVKPEVFDRLVPSPSTRSPPKLALAVLLAVALFLLTYPAVQQGLPRFVNANMLGWPILAAAGLGLVALPYIRGPAAHIGASVVAATYPFVIYNPFDSPFWPHRTAVYAGIGLVIIGAVVTARLVTTIGRQLPRLMPEGAARQGSTLALVPILLVGLSLGGVWAATPDATDHRWYRLFDECEMTALQDVADEAAEDPEAIVITGDWRPKLVVAALSGNASRVWFTSTFYTNDSERQDLVSYLDSRQAPYYVVIDQHTRWNTDANVTFLDGPEWEQTDASTCTRDDGAPRVAVYQHIQR